MGKFRDYLHAFYDVVEDVLEVVVVMAEAAFPRNRVSAMILKLLKLALPFGVYLGAESIQHRIPGVENLYPWAWRTIALGGYFAIATLIVAWRYRYKLDQHPTVEIAETPIQDGAQYYVPVKNCGPGDVKVSVTAKDIEFGEGQGRLTGPRAFPVKFVRWDRGNGNQVLDTPNWEKIREHGEWRLYLLNLDHESNFNNQRARSGDIQAANSGENCNLVAHARSKVRITLQAFGEPTLCKETIQSARKQYKQSRLRCHLYQPSLFNRS